MKSKQIFIWTILLIGFTTSLTSKSVYGQDLKAASQEKTQVVLEAYKGSSDGTKMSINDYLDRYEDLRMVGYNIMLDKSLVVVFWAPLADVNTMKQVDYDYVKKYFSIGAEFVYRYVSKSVDTYHVVLTNTYESDSSAHTYQNSNVIELYMGRWASRREDGASGTGFARVVSVHEMAHVINYIHRYDPDVYWRELAANVTETYFELSSLSQGWNETMLGGSQTGIFSEVRGFAKYICDKIAKDNSVKTVQTFMLSFLKSENPGNQAFDEALNEIGYSNEVTYESTYKDYQDWRIEK